MPDEYQRMNIEEFLVNQCPRENQDRLLSEISEYKRRDLLNLLRQMKYIVDTLRKNNIVWGVGRGSSVASYVLFLLGVHKIDSVKYNLPIEEFFKGEQNG
jgi:DNA polymerase III alpha subunit